jgi:hypothetical protein
MNCTLEVVGSIPGCTPRITTEVDKSSLLVACFPTRRPGFEPRSGHVGFMVEKVALGQVFSEYFGFPCQFSFHRLLHIHRHLSSGAGTIGQLVADVPSRLCLAPPQETKTNSLLTSLLAKVGINTCNRQRSLWIPSDSVDMIILQYNSTPIAANFVAASIDRSIHIGFNTAQPQNMLESSKMKQIRQNTLQLKLDV